MSVILRELNGDNVTSYVSFAHDDILTITPVEYLEPNTTYEVILPAGGIKDVANNTIEGYSFRFSTGGNVTVVDQPPAINSVNVSDATPDAGQNITTSIAASHPQGLALQYRFNPGDGSADSGWVNQSSFSHSYTTSGHFDQTLEVRDANGRIDSHQPHHRRHPRICRSRLDSLRPHVARRAGPQTMGRQPDNDSVAEINVDTDQRVAIHDLSALAANGRVNPWERRSRRTRTSMDHRQGR